MNQDLPPKKPVCIVKTVNQNQYKPFLVYLTHDVSQKMDTELNIEGLNWDTFFQLACIEYLRRKQDEKDERNRYIAFSEMQLFEQRDAIIAQIDLEAAETTSSDTDDIKDLFYP